MDGEQLGVAYPVNFREIINEELASQLKSALITEMEHHFPARIVAYNNDINSVNRKMLRTLSKAKMGYRVRFKVAVEVNNKTRVKMII